MNNKNGNNPFNILEASEKKPAVKKIPEELPILPIKGTIVFPLIIVPLVAVKERAIKLIDDALEGDKILGLVAQKNLKKEIPGKDDVYRVGTASTIAKMLRFPDGSLRLLVQGISRIRIKEFTQEEPYLKATVEIIEERWEKGVKVEALMRNIVSMFQKLIELSPHLPEELEAIVINIEEPGRLADFIVANLNFELEDKQKILETFGPVKRLQNLTPILMKEINILELGAKIRSQVKDEIDEDQRKFYLREQLKAIQKELGEKDERTIEIEELKKKIKKAKMPKDVEKVAMKELERLGVIPVQAAEYHVIRTYLDWLVNLPWSKETKDNLAIKEVEKVLNDDHYNLEDVKERIIEFLAVRKLKKDSKGPILCFIGPPGVGKTSLGKSIARALGRKFVRFSLGGVRDEAEIRGHRRTYVAALPGRIIQGIKHAGSNNPVFMLDEVDKIGVDFRGDPAAALLEVLDPEQNNSFSDHYLEVAFDLSKVMFITTGNIIDPIPPALKDRMEIITLPGYIIQEKLEIAKSFLIPRQVNENGLSKKLIKFTDNAILEIVNDYTREAGVRNLERSIGSICRKVARKVAEGRKTLSIVNKGNVKEFLGPAKYYSEIAERTGGVGIATGLAWTRAGGEILFVEATKMHGKKCLTLTGQMGDVMQESAEAALSYIRSNAKRFGIDGNFYDKYDIHIHIPEGAIPKDGPSAGITMSVALASLLTEKPVKPDVAMTGEITLRGKILPIGGVKEKVMAAKRAGIKEIILPEKNRSNLEEISDKVKRGIKFVFIDCIDDAIQEALERKKRNPRKTKSKRKKKKRKFSF
ncbi:MAG: endopeptidase La [Candidatus Cloacimonadota bacterium]|nr:MAG: endopeptidase La [Candidatus Cloacimonadota bacterium]